MASPPPPGRLIRQRLRLGHRQVRRAEARLARAGVEVERFHFVKLPDAVGQAATCSGVGVSDMPGAFLRNRSAGGLNR